MIYYTPEEFAEMLKVQPSTVRAWLRDGVLKGHKVMGKTWRISEEQYQQFLKERCPTNEDVDPKKGADKNG